jgi:hypothetical protein
VQRPSEACPQAADHREGLAAMRLFENPSTTAGPIPLVLERSLIGPFDDD